MKHPNALINETSPYLLQHAYNPVDWHPWNDQTLEKAKQANKLLLISIGYSSCHWCHVMEKESFEDERVARMMNEHYVCIKVDREERPDVDQVYMQAVQLISGTGGWPLNCIALPDGKPVWGGTYFRKDQWIGILTRVAHLYHERPGEIMQYASELTEGIKRDDWFGNSITIARGYMLADLEKAFSNAKCRLDWTNGGTTGAPKFPLPVNLLFLIRFYNLTNNRNAWDFVRLTLRRMALGGIYDRLGGGFARYSTDSEWKVPHFEKMLYDNAQIISLYSEAFRVEPSELYTQVINETIGFIRNEMTSPQGWFYSGLDADSQGKEGDYYVWTASQMRDILGPDAPLALEYFQVTEDGNWEQGLNILLRIDNEGELAGQWEMTVDELQAKILSINQRLLEERQKRVKPGVDDKLITCWNALMIRAYVDAYQALHEPALLVDAIRAMEFLLAHLTTPQGGLWRTYKAGRAKIEGFLDDYAATTDALLALYQVTFDRRWLDEAINLVDFVWRHFKEDESGMFFYTSDQAQPLVVSKFEWVDTVIPSSNSIMAHTLFTLGHIMDNEVYIARSEKMVLRMKDHLSRYLMSFANWGLLAMKMAVPLKIVAITGKEALLKQQELQMHYDPWKILVGSTGPSTLVHLENRWVEGETWIYVCSGSACFPPVKEVSRAVAFLLGEKM